MKQDKEIEVLRSTGEMGGTRGLSPIVPKSYLLRIEILQKYSIFFGFVTSTSHFVYVIILSGISGLHYDELVNEYFFITFFLAIALGLISSIFGNIAFEKNIRQIQFDNGSIIQSITDVLNSGKSKRIALTHAFAIFSLACLFFVSAGTSVCIFLILSIVYK